MASKLGKELGNSDFHYTYWTGSGWTAWSSTLSGGRAARKSDNQAVVLRFKIPDGANNVFWAIKFAIPYVRENNKYLKTATSGTLYFKIFDTDPRNGEIIDVNNNNKDTSWSWNTTDQQVHYTRTGKQGEYDTYATILKNFKSGQYYYLGIGASSPMQIGYQHTTYPYTGALYYFTKTSPTKPTITLKDNGDNTVTLSGNQSNVGENNEWESSRLYYSFTDTKPENSNNYASLNTSNKTYSFTCNIPETNNGTLSAVVKNKIKVFTGHDNNLKVLTEIKEYSASAKVSIKYYAPPKQGDGKLKVSPERLTRKKPWVFEWKGLATKANDNSPIAGYRIRLYRAAAGSGATAANVKDTIQIYDANGKGLAINGSTTSGGHDMRYDRDNVGNEDNTTITIDPERHGCFPGDKIGLLIQPYIKNGKGIKKFDENVKDYESWIVQNAGVVNVKVDNEWKEGQVWVKVNGAWKEAETINVKVDGAWKESE